MFRTMSVSATDLAASKIGLRSFACVPVIVVVRLSLPVACGSTIVVAACVVARVAVVEVVVGALLCNVCSNEECGARLR